MVTATSVSRSRSSSCGHDRGRNEASRAETGGECTGSDEAITIWHPAPRHRLSEKCKFGSGQYADGRLFASHTGTHMSSGETCSWAGPENRDGWHLSHLRGQQREKLTVSRTGTAAGPRVCCSRVHVQWLSLTVKPGLETLGPIRPELKRPGTNAVPGLTRSSSGSSLLL